MAWKQQHASWARVCDLAGVPWKAVPDRDMILAPPALSVLVRLTCWRPGLKHEFGLGTVERNNVLASALKRLIVGDMEFYRAARLARDLGWSVLWRFLETQCDIEVAPIA